MQITNMYKPIRPRRNSMPSSNVHRSRAKISSKTEYNIPNNSKGFHDSLRTKSKTPIVVEHNEMYATNGKHFLSHSLSDGDETLDTKTNFFKVAKQNHVTKSKRTQFFSTQPIDTPNKRLQEIPVQHSPPSYESPQRYDSYKKFKEDNHIKQIVVEKYALLKQLINIDEYNGDNFYAGAKFNNSPSPSDLPLPPMQWLNSCQAQANKTIQNTPLLFNITM